jgi:CubicO group peptidase (beta-lactamase class C family)
VAGRIPATLRRAACVLATLLVGSTARAQQPPTSVVPPVPTQVRQAELPPAAAPATPGTTLPRGLRGRAELEAFLDGVMIANLRDKHIAGATVAVVKDGEVLLTKGYGRADVARGADVRADRSLFRIGSVSKLFTWTAVMQLQEQGKLDLDADVNRYLDFKIPATYAQPITLRHVLTHTPGFEEDGRDLFTNDSARAIPLGRWLTTHLPERVRAPGTYSSYSNYATALAGYVVERASGLPWDDYVDQRILAPLGMAHTTTRQPLPAALRADMSGGYAWSGGRFEPKPFEIVTGAGPAGSISSTADDMAKFMLAHLGGGALGTGRILADSTTARMHARAFTHDERIPGFGLGFYEKSSHGLRIVGHGGDTQWFHSDLALVPSERLGVFVSYNTSTGGELSFGPFLNQFLDHYYPTPATPVAALSAADAEEQARRVAGEYAFNRRSYSTFQKALGLASTITVSAADSGRLVMNSALGQMHLRPVGPLLYRDDMDGGLVAFRAEGSGPATVGFLGIAPMMALERVPWYASPRLHWVVLGLAVVVFVLTLLAAAGRLARRRFGTPRPEDALPGRWMVVLVAALNVAFLVAVGVILGSSGGLLEGPLTGLKVALALPVIAALLTIGAAVTAVRHWRGGVGTRGARLRYGATVALAVLFVWSLNQWNLLGWRL